MESEAQLQSAVWHIDLGRGKRVLQWLAVILSAIALSLVYTAGQFRGLEKREAMDLAQLARNLSRGQGFTTYVIRPLSLWHLKVHRLDHNPQFAEHPDLYNPPLYPLVLAGLFRLLPPTVFEMKSTDLVYTPERWVILPFDQICLLLSLLLIYFWAKRLFDHRVALTATLLLLFSDTLWSYGVSGLPTTFLMLLLLAAMYCLFLADQRLNPAETEAQPLDSASLAWLLGSAVLLGLCFLTRYLAGFLIVPMAIYAARALRGRQGWVWGLVYGAVFLAVITPWLIRNERVSGSLLGVARYQIIETETLDRTYHVDLKDAYILRRMTSRFLVNLRSQFVEGLKKISADFLVCFFVTGLMYGFRRTEVTRLRRVLLGALAFSIFGVALIGFSIETAAPDVNGANLLVPLLPLVAVFGVAFFYLMLDRLTFRMKLTHALAISVFVLANLAPMIFTLLPPRRGNFPYPPYCAPYTNLLRRWFAQDEVGTSDLPWSVAWYADRRTVWLPAEQDEYYEIHDFVAPHNTQFLLLTPYMLDSHYQSDLLKGQYKSWAGLVRGQVPNAFPLKAATILPPGNDQILIADQPRWVSAGPREPAAGKSTGPATGPPSAVATPK